MDSFAGFDVTLANSVLMHASTKAPLVQRVP